MGGKYRLTTLGCKVNQYESQLLRETLESLGFAAAGPTDEPDLAIVNTCAVTASATRKSRQSIRRLARQGRVPTVVVGCGASAATASLQSIPGVIAVLGHDQNVHLALRRVVTDPLHSGWVCRHHAEDAGRFAAACGSSYPDESAVGNDVRMRATAPPRIARVSEETDQTPASNTIIPSRSPAVKNADGTDRATIRAFAGHQRAFLKVQDGCDANCTYCIIPRLRPVLRWKPLSIAVSEARDLVRAGHKEIVITGIHLGAYGRPTARHRRHDPATNPLADLVEALAAVQGLVRLRLSSLEPGDVDNRLLAVLRRNPCCAPHLHLPLQSGSDAVLRRMNRQYTAGQFQAMIDRVRTALDRPAISTDIVVGFPGESDADFEKTLTITRQSGFCKVHSFPFSPRPGTAAAKWSRDFIPADVVRHRMARLAELERETALAFRRHFIGRTERVIIEAGDDENAPPPAPDGSAWRHGRTDRYFPVWFQAAEAAPGDVVAVRIENVSGGRVRGTVTKTLR